MNEAPELVTTPEAARRLGVPREDFGVEGEKMSRNSDAQPPQFTLNGTGGHLLLRSVGRLSSHQRRGTIVRSYLGNLDYLYSTG